MNVNAVNAIQLDSLPFRKEVGVGDLYRLRHSCAHILAQAVVEIWPEAKLGIGPPIDDGFYYDFELPVSITPDDLDRLEAIMRRIIDEGHDFVRDEPGIDAIRALLAAQPYKLELLNVLANPAPPLLGAGGPSPSPIPMGEGVGGEGSIDSLPFREGLGVGVYRQSTFVDLCRGPHVDNTRDIDPDAVKLLHTAGAYWKGDSSRPMLQRIYGTAWKTKADLDAHLARLDEAKRRDHRHIGKNRDFFSTSQAVGPGLVLWHPKAAMVRFLADQFSQQAHLLNGYEWVYTPHIGRAGLWETSGHLDFYKDSMYSPIEIDGDQYYLKPMSCPFHIEIYKSRPRSYRELPVRYAEYAQVYRYELSGTLHGMTRVRGFCQDDAHSFCIPGTVGVEIRQALKFSLYVLRTFGLHKFKAYVSTRPEEKSIGSVDQWNDAIDQLKSAAVDAQLDYAIDEGGGAFYGPKIDLKVQDSLGREWQLSTIQFDFNLPERFGLEYIGPDGQAHQPYMVHRALFGSAERFFAMLVEHYAGAFPLWLAPTQVTIIPITDHQVDYAHAIAADLKRHRMRVDIDTGDDRMSGKIRAAEVERVPYILVVGKKEVEASTVSVRSREEGDLGPMTIDAFLESTKVDREAGTATAFT